MRITSSILPALLLAAPAAFTTVAAASVAQASEDLTEWVQRELVQSEGKPVDEIWKRAGALRDLATTLGSEDLDPVLDRLLAKHDAKSEAGSLLLTAARLGGADAEAGLLADLLQPVLASSNESYAAAAAALFADPQMRTLTSSRREEALEQLASVAEDGSLAPSLRLAASEGLFELGWGAERRAARRVMGAFLASADAELRAEGALALAKTGAEVTGPLYDELRTLARVPDARGRLAASYLEVEDVRREASRKVKRIESYYEGAQGGEGSLPKNQIEQLQRVVQMIENYHLEGDAVTNEDLLAAAMDGMLRSLDEHSSYLPPRAYARFEQDLEAGYGGIGAYVGEDREDGLFTITNPIYSGPAYKGGLLSEDKIVRVDDWPTIGEPVDEVIKRLKGKPGTSVKLYVWRRGMNPELIDRPTEDMAIVVERASITIPSVSSQYLPGDIGMVALRDFSRVAAQELRKPLEEMKARGMRGVILDLRNNSGGLLDQAVEVAGLFLPKGTLVVSTESRVASTERLKTRNQPVVPADMPVIVLVNRFSASAAEIVSGALQDHGRATLVGKRSFGKGSVQNLVRVIGMSDDVYTDENDNGRFDSWEPIVRDHNGNGEFDFAPRIKMTIARYRLPSGRSIHREFDKEGNELSKGGVEPDLTVAARRLEAWRLEELYRLRRDHVVRDYLDGLVSANAERADWLRERFYEIAENDRKDVSLYPEFESFYEGLESPLTRDDVRQLVRAEIRRRVQDSRGQEFPPGDFVEDTQLQEAIRVALKAIGRSPMDFPQYTAIPSVEAGSGSLAALEGEELREAIEAARNGDGRLSPEALQQLYELLEKRSEGDK